MLCKKQIYEYNNVYELILGDEAMGKVIGKVIATEKNPSTIDDFYFWTKQDTILNPFDVVKIGHLENSVSYGVIEEISHITDTANFLSDYISNDFGQVNTSERTHRIGMNYVKASVIGNNKNIYIPLLNDAKVELAEEEEIAEALGLNKVKNPVTCGYLEMYNNKDKITLPVKMDSRFLIGPEGAHLNISGISGLAAKTSYAMFLLKAIQDKCYEADSEDDVAFVFFNVKGKDLLAIDQPAEFDKESDKEWVYGQYTKLGLTTLPFRNVHYYYPYSASEEQMEKLMKGEFQPKKVEQFKVASNFCDSFMCISEKEIEKNKNFWDEEFILVQQIIAANIKDYDTTNQEYDLKLIKKNLGEDSQDKEEESNDIELFDLNGTVEHIL